MLAGENWVHTRARFSEGGLPPPRARVCYDLLSMQTGIIGLPQVGKTTLFRILTRAQLDEKSAHAATHVGIARVPEPRIDQLAELYKPKKVTYATVEYV